MVHPPHSHMITRQTENFKMKPWYLDMFSTSTFLSSWCEFPDFTWKHYARFTFHNFFSKFGSQSRKWLNELGFGVRGTCPFDEIRAGCYFHCHYIRCSFQTTEISCWGTSVLIMCLLDCTSNDQLDERELLYNPYQSLNHEYIFYSSHFR